MLKTARTTASSGKAGVCEEQASLSSVAVATAWITTGEDQFSELVEFLNSLTVVVDTLLDTGCCDSVALCEGA